jgi:hypothetical protein
MNNVEICNFVVIFPNESRKNIANIFSATQNFADNIHNGKCFGISENSYLTNNHLFS